MLIWPKNFFFTKFEYGYQKNNPEFYADFKNVEKNVKVINLYAKQVSKTGVCPHPFYLFSKVFGK